jgi:putative oxidoreductase
MKSLIANEHVALLSRLIVGALFLFASIDKAANPALFALSIQHYKVIPPALAMLVATVLPWLELLCGFSLVTGIFVRGGSSIISLLLVGFTLLVASAMVRQLDISCGCFTLNPDAGKIGWQKIAENIGMLALSLISFFAPPSRYTVEAFLSPKNHSV